jgi:hypothetical protein
MVLITVWIAAQGGCDWFADPVEINLLPWVTITSCPSGGEVVTGDDVTFEWAAGDYDGTIAEFEWSYDDTVVGATFDDVLTVEDVAEGDHVFIIVAIDDKGDESPPDTCLFAVGTAGGLVDRNVLVEFITTFACVNCPFGEEALNNLMDEYGADRLCVVAYHDDTQVGTDETIARIDWYTDNPDFPGSPVAYPIAVFDGGRIVEGSSSVSTAQENYELEIELRRAIGSPLSMRLVGDLGGGRASLTAKVRVMDALPVGTYVLRTVVLENDINFAHELFPFVARDILDDVPFTLAAVGDSVEVVYDVTIDPGWNPANLDAIAFVQNDETMEIAQSARLEAR